MQNNKFTKFAPAILAAILFGASTPLSKILVGEIDPIFLAALLYLGSGMGAVLLMFIQGYVNKEKRVEAKISQKDIPWLTGAIFAGGVAAPILLLFSLKETPAATASLLLNFEGVATTIIAALLFKEAIGRRINSAIILVTLASILLSFTGGGEYGFSLGVLGILGACVLWGLDNNFTRNISSKDPMVIVAIKGLSAGFFSLFLCFVMQKSIPSIEKITEALILGCFSYGLSTGLFIFSLRSLGAARTAALFGIAPFIGTFLSVVILNEVPTTLFLISAIVMVIGAALLLTEEHSHFHVHSVLSHEHRHSHFDNHHLHDNLENLTIRGEHSHSHQHKTLIHDHAHTPDLHHRHSHKKN